MVLICHYIKRFSISSEFLRFRSSSRGLTRARLRRERKPDALFVQTYRAKARRFESHRGLLLFPVGRPYTIGHMSDDAELLREYAEHGSEEAFRTLVERHSG